MNVNGLIKARTPHADLQQVQETQKAPGLGECYNQSPGSVLRSRSFQGQQRRLRGLLQGLPGIYSCLWGEV